MGGVPSRLRRARRGLVASATAIAVVAIYALAAPGAGWAATFAHHLGELDCNGNSPIQQAVRLSMNCTDIRGFAGIDNQNTWGGRFYDNGTYIGHDEPDMTFLSNRPGSGNSVTWTETLGKDPSAAPTATNPGSDVAHYFELTPAPWFSMAMCDPNSYPQLGCNPKDDANAPACSPSSSGGCPPPERFPEAAQRSWRCSSTRPGSRPSSTPPAATTSIGAGR